MTRFFYSLLIYLLVPITPFKLLWRGWRQPAYLKNWSERYGFFSIIPSKPIIWIHCVSVGETRAAQVVVNELLRLYPENQILITHATPTGRETSERIFGDRILRCYLPYDLPGASRRFIEHFEPIIGVLMETELWFNLIATCSKKKIPLILANARLSEKSAQGYKKVKRLSRQGLRDLTLIAAQNEEDASRFIELGASKVIVTGNMKFDVLPPKDASILAQALREKVAMDRPVFLAASTRDGEEELIINAINSAQSKFLTILVPRHPERFNLVADLLKRQGISFFRRTEILNNALPHDFSNYRVLLGDSMGEMFTYYGACDFAFVGGSLLDFGGQNLIEACLMAKPVVIGPFTYNFKRITELAVEAGAVIRIQEAGNLSKVIDRLITDKGMREAMGHAAFEFSKRETGASKELLRFIEEIVPRTV